MRAIKFRALHKKYGLVKIHHLDFSEKSGNIRTIHGSFDNGQSSLSTDDKKETILMQYTGLKDCNNQEIYEGDIVKIDNNELYKITFESGAFRATPLNKEALSRFCSDSGIFFVYLCRDDNVKVVGNVFENGDLLK